MVRFYSTILLLFIIVVYFIINTNFTVKIEKMLREAAAFEVSLANQSTLENDEHHDEDGEQKNDNEIGNQNKKPKLLSSEEKSLLNKEKNREHARNTRRRKKIFVSKLKELVDLLTQQKIAEKKDRITLGKRIAETVC